MAPQELNAPESCFTGIRAEQNASEANSDCASRVPEPYLQQKNELLRHATQRGCNSLSPEFTVGREPCHVPSAPQAAPAGRNTLI